ncbi:MAG TPA: hypothetical protein VGM88_22525 [Kofleriaceae bacterium]|jgi:ABC-type transport system involved in multi-copper enzyme maturation permease subunit
MSAVWSLAQVTWTRVLRGRALWVAIGIGVLPLLVAVFLSVMPRGTTRTEVLFAVISLLIAILPAMFVGASLADELEAKTAAYLWSRPIPRWAVLAGKLLALAPLAAGIVLVAWLASTELTSNHPPSAASCVAVVVGTLSSSVIASAIAAWWPSHGMSVTIAYMIFVDLSIGAMPSTIEELSISHQMRTIAGMTGSPLWHGALGLAILTAVWGWLAVRRMRRLEV